MKIVLMGAAFVWAFRACVRRAHGTGVALAEPPRMSRGANLYVCPRADAWHTIPPDRPADAAALRGERSQPVSLFATAIPKEGIVFASSPSRSAAVADAIRGPRSVAGTFPDGLKAALSRSVRNIRADVGLAMPIPNRGNRISSSRHQCRAAGNAVARSKSRGGVSQGESRRVISVVSASYRPGSLRVTAIPNWGKGFASSRNRAQRWRVIDSGDR